MTNKTKNGNEEIFKGFYRSIQTVGIFLAAVLLIALTVRTARLAEDDAIIKKNQEIIKTQLVEMHKHLDHLDANSQPAKP